MISSGRDLKGRGARRRPDLKSLQVALDIANWLPEIAADSDMPEAPWNKVSAGRRCLVADYQAAISASDGSDTRELVSTAEGNLGARETAFRRRRSLVCRNRKTARFTVKPAC